MLGSLLLLAPLVALRSLRLSQPSILPAVSPRHATAAATLAAAAGGGGGPTDTQSAALATAQPSPALQPREVIETVMCALHRRNQDTPYARFGSEVAMRFLSPDSPASQRSLEQFADYLSQEWYRPLVEWSEMRWDGDLVLLGNGAEAYQQAGVRSSPTAAWVSIRWILARVLAEGGHEEWRVATVFVQEPDSTQSDDLEAAALALPAEAAAAISRWRKRQMAEPRA